MDKRVLVEIPPNETFPHSRLMTMSAHKLKKALSEARETSAHWFYGMRPVYEAEEWPRFGYIADEYGNPIANPDAVSLAKLKYDEAEENKQRYNEEDDSPTVGDLKEQMREQAAQISELVNQQKRTESQMKAEVAATTKAAQADVEAVKKPKPRAKKAVA